VAPAGTRHTRDDARSLMRRRSDPRSPVQSAGNPWWAPFLLAFLAALAFWTWQQRRIAFDEPEKAETPRTAEQPRPPQNATEATQPVQDRAKANLPALFSSNDYPVEAIRNEEQGTVAFKLSIDRRGKVSRCDVTSSSGSPALDRATCSILVRRARYTPAMDAQGNRVPDEDSGKIRWELPDE